MWIVLWPNLFVLDSFECIKLKIKKWRGGGWREKTECWWYGCLLGFPWLPYNCNLRSNNTNKQCVQIIFGLERQYFVKNRQIWRRSAKSGHIANKTWWWYDGEGGVRKANVHWFFFNNLIVKAKDNMVNNSSQISHPSSNRSWYHIKLAMSSWPLSKRHFAPRNVLWNFYYSYMKRQEDKQTKRKYHPKSIMKICYAITRQRIIQSKNYD